MCVLQGVCVCVCAHKHKWLQCRGVPETLQATRKATREPGFLIHVPPPHYVHHPQPARCEPA